LRTADCPSIRSWPAKAGVRLTSESVSGLVLVVLALILCNGASAQSLQPEIRPSTVHGRVVNAVTHEPISRALVYSSDNRYASLTDGEGHFEFALPNTVSETGIVFSGQPQRVWSTGAAGSLRWLMARKPGFLDDSLNGTPTEFTLGSEVTIALPPEALIIGRVTIPAGDPARGVDVQLFSRQVQDGGLRWMQTNSVRTNASGEFRFAELKAGTYKLLTREWMDNDPITAVPDGLSYGFPPVYYPAAADFALASTVHLGTGQTAVADMSLVRQPYYPVKIPVTNTEENGGMNVSVWPQGQRGPGYSLGYNRGKGMIEGQLPNGKYVVEANVYGPNAASGSVNIAVAGGPVDGPGIVLARTNSIPVNVKEEFTSTNWNAHGSWSDGKHTFDLHGPRLDLNIQATPAEDFGSQISGSIRPPTRANDDSLVLENLFPGRYWLRAQAQRGYIASATMGGTDLLREPLVVVPGASTPIDITMRDDNAELEGTLLGEPTTPHDTNPSTSLGFIECIPLPDSTGQFLEISASPDGKFDYRMITPGAYRVIAFATRQRDIPYHDAEAMKLYETKGQVVHFAPGQKVALQLQLASGD
jgi:hypothetical protein